MTVFVDTAALYALLDEDDRFHEQVVAWFASVGADPDLALVTHSYVVIEATALMPPRLGGRALRVLLDDLLPAVAVAFVDEPLHRRAVSAYLAGLSRGSSFVDRVSFEFMRDQAITTAFTLDADFSDEGFTIVPST